MANDIKKVIQYLTILELSLDKPITQELVRTQYRKLVKIYHPDAHEEHYGDGERFKLLHEAYEFCYENVDYVNKLIASDFWGSTTNLKKEEQRNSNEEFTNFVNVVQTSLTILGLPLDKPYTHSVLNLNYSYLFRRFGNNQEAFKAVATAYDFLKANIEAINVLISSRYNYDSFVFNLAREETRKKAEADRRAKEEQERRKREEEIRKRQLEEQKKSQEFYLEELANRRKAIVKEKYNEEKYNAIMSVFDIFANKKSSISSFSNARVLLANLEHEISRYPTIEQQKKKKKILIIAGSTILSIGVIIATVFTSFSIVNHNEEQRKLNAYNAALKLLDDGNFAEAYNSFDELGNYKDSNTKKALAINLNNIKTNIGENPFNEEYLVALNGITAVQVNYSCGDHKYNDGSSNYACDYDRENYSVYKPEISNGYLVSTWTYQSVSYISSLNKSFVGVEATWKQFEGHITYNLDGGTNSQLNPSTFAYESEDIILHNPTKLGFVFIGWFNESDERVFAIQKHTSIDIVLNAKWVIDNYTKIQSMADFLSIKDNVNGNYLLTTNLDFNSVAFEPINNFNGVFNGGLHTISNTSNVLFNTNNGIIENCRIENSNALNNIRAPFVYYNKGTIMNCSFSGDIHCETSSGYLEVGGIASTNVGEITECYFNGNIEAINHDDGGYPSYAGGIVGKNSDDSVKNQALVKFCYSTGSIYAEGNGCGGYAGGIAGINYYYYKELSHCYFSGNVEGKMLQIVPSHDAGVGFISGGYFNGEDCYYYSTSTMKVTNGRESYSGTGMTDYSQMVNASMDGSGIDNYWLKDNIGNPVLPYGQVD